MLEKRISAIAAGIADSEEADHGQRLKRQEERHVAEQREHVLHELEGLGHDRQRARRGLAPGARELVVELGVLEVAELEGQRLLQDEHVDVDAEPRAQGGADQDQTALDQRLRRDQRELEKHPAQVAAPSTGATTASTMPLPT